MNTIPTKEQIIGYIFTHYNDDEEFIKLINDMTYSRKLQLRSRRLNVTKEHERE